MGTNPPWLEWHVNPVVLWIVDLDHRVLPGKTWSQPARIGRAPPYWSVSSRHEDGSKCLLLTELHKFADTDACLDRQSTDVPNSWNQNGTTLALLSELCDRKVNKLTDSTLRVMTETEDFELFYWVKSHLCYLPSYLILRNKYFEVH